MTAPHPSPSPPQAGYVIPAKYWAWLGTPRARAALVWLIALISGVALTYRAFHWLDDPPDTPPERRRVDGNGAHAQIDFGGQWLMGRMIATGHGRELYHRQRQRQILLEGYPVENESETQREQSRLPSFLRTRAHPEEDWQHDAANLMNWSMGDDPPEWKTVGGAVAAPVAQPPTGNPFIAAALQKAAADAVTPEVVAATAEKPAVGGPLYPPVHALFYAPLGSIDRPQRAYHLLQVILALLIPVAGLGVKVLSRGRIWWSVATVCLFFYPGTRGGLDLGQNPSLSLCIAIWGWVLASRGYNVAGGMVWGLFAFKPVWAAALFLVPLLMCRWRFCGAMVLTGAALGLLTLPIVGVESWFHWLEVGDKASKLYKINANWINLSRDLQGIPRRFLLDFNAPQHERATPLANAAAWGLWGLVLGTTVVVYSARGNRARPTGTGAAFLFLGAFLTCFHFMFYDALLSAAALAVLFAEPKRFFRTPTFAVDPAPLDPRAPADRELPAAPPSAPSKPFGARMRGYFNSFPLTVVVALFVTECWLTGLDFQATVGMGYLGTPATDGSTNASVPRVQVGTNIKYPIDTFLLLALWVWCGWQLLRGSSSETTNAPPMTHQ